MRRILLVLLLLFGGVASASQQITVQRILRPSPVIVIGGQSNSTAYIGPTLYTFRHNGGSCQSINFSTGVATTAVEPLPDLDGGLSTWASPLCDLLLDNINIQKVWLINISLGGTKFADFAVGGQYNGRIATAKSRIDSLGLTATHVIWGQGETDALTSSPATAFQSQIQSIIDTFRNNGISAPIIIPKETFNQGAIPANAGTQVRAAQAAVVNGTDIFAGPDLDTLGNAFRIQDAQQVHFNVTGRDYVAPLMAALVLAH